MDDNTDMANVCAPNNKPRIISDVPFYGTTKFIHANEEQETSLNNR